MENAYSSAQDSQQLQERVFNNKIKEARIVIEGVFQQLVHGVL